MDEQPDRCVFCEQPLEPAPTMRGWLQFGNKGIHHHCADRLHEISQAIRSSDVLILDDSPLPSPLEFREHGAIE